MAQTTAKHIYHREMMLLLFLSTVVVTEACIYGEVVLSGGDTKYEGRVDVCLNGRWNTICQDSFWDYREAWVICRQLGFLDTGIVNRHTYPPGAGKILSEVECSTTERRLIECNYKQPPATNCTHVMDAGVKCRDGGTPTDLQYNVHNSSVSLSWNASMGEEEALQHYSATCSGWRTYSSELLPEHNVQVRVDINTTRALLQGLMLDMLLYNCCVAANYVTYSPTACISINISQVNEVHTETTFGDVEENKTTSAASSGVATVNITTTVNKQSDQIQVTSAKQANNVLMIAIGSVLGIFLLIFVFVSLSSWICTCLVCRKLSHKRLQERSLEASQFDNVLYESQNYASVNTINGHNSNDDSKIADQNKAEYEMVDLPTYAARRSMVKSQYEFSETANVKDEESNRPEERYEFCDVNTDDKGTSAESSKPTILSRETNSRRAKEESDMEYCEDGYERLKLIPAEIPTVRPPNTIELLPRECGSDRNYSSTRVSDKDDDRVYSHTTPRNTDDGDDHSYSHVWLPQDGQPSPGYLHLDTTSPHLLSSSAHSITPRNNKESGLAAVKGYSYLNVSEMTSPVTTDAVKHVNTSGGYHTLDVDDMISEPTTVCSTHHQQNGTAKLSTKKIISGYSDLKIGELSERASKSERSPDSADGTSGYSHLNIYEDGSENKKM